MTVPPRQCDGRTHTGPPAPTAHRARRTLCAAALFGSLALAAAGASGATRAPGEPEADDPRRETAPGPMSAVVGIDREQLSCFAGGYAAGEFLTAEQAAPGLRHGEVYALYDLAGRRGEVIAIGTPHGEGSEGECAELWRQELSLDPLDKGRPAVALRLPQGRPDPLPKVLELLPEPLGWHRELVRDFLSKRGVADPEPAITQAIRTDIDGDGTPEYILNSVRVDPEATRAGDHSLVLVVRGEAPSSRTYIIQDEIDVQDKPFSSTLWTSTIVAVVDVDGDGTAEIVTEGGFVYGGGWDVIRFDGAGFDYVLFCGCEG